MTTQRVINERQYLIDASIIKIMKRNKKLLFDEMMNEVFNDLKLPLQVEQKIIPLNLIISVPKLNRG